MNHVCVRKQLEIYPVPTAPLTHSALQWIYFVSNKVYRETMDNFLVFPSLKNFGYDCTKICPSHLNSFISLFNYSQCQFTRSDLSLENSGRLMDDLVPLFSALPTLRHLKLEDLKDLSDDTEDEGIMTDKLLQFASILRKLTLAEGIWAARSPIAEILWQPKILMELSRGLHYR